MRPRQALAVVEAAYDLDASPRDWLRQAGEAYAAIYPDVRGVFAHRMSISPSGQITFHEAHMGGVDDPVRLLEEVHGHLAPEHLLAFYPPGALAGSFREQSKVLPDPSTAAVVEELMAGSGAGEMVAVGGLDARRDGVVVGLMVARASVDEAERLASQRLSVHLMSGARLRRALGQRDPLDAAEAVLEPDGRVAHASGEAASLRESLRSTVRRLDSSRTRKKGAPDDTLEIWQGLVEGRWSLVDRFDGDGRRYYVALVNPALLVPSRALLAAEAQVVAMVVAGESIKLIGYALGMPESTVSTHLTSAMRKMGAQSRVDLIRIGRELLEVV